jgi:CheY-like chemotaxis protein
MDNGQGMDKAVLERIFEPFFSTKPQGEGTGMGLSTVLGIVQSHGGALRVTSELGKGSSFEILLPAVPAVRAGAAKADSRPATGSERILLIDDEKQIVQIGHRLLTRLGYTVQTCLDPKEALALFSRNPHAFDLVITDLAMPKIQGTTLIGQLRRVRADIPIILCTGNVNQVSDQQRQALGIREILAKPILRDDLARAVRRAMAPAADDFYPLAAETA